jgi:putative SOS response-associated peptidase YedK
MPEIIKAIGGGYIVTDASGKIILARVKTLPQAKAFQSSLEKQRRLILSGSTETKIPKNIGTPEMFRKFMSMRSKNPFE